MAKNFNEILNNRMFLKFSAAFSVGVGTFRSIFPFFFKYLFLKRGSGAAKKIKGKREDGKKRGRVSMAFQWRVDTLRTLGPVNDAIRQQQHTHTHTGIGKIARPFFLLFFFAPHFYEGEAERRNPNRSLFFLFGAAVDPVPREQKKTLHPKPAPKKKGKENDDQLGVGPHRVTEKPGKTRYTHR